MDVLHYFLAPVALPQALWLRRTALQMPEPEGPREGAEGEGPPLRLLIVGDSSAAGVGVARQEDALSGQLVRLLAPRHRVDWRLIARTGATVPETVARLQDTEQARFDAALIGLGVNDAKNGGTVAAWRWNYAVLMDLLQAKFGVSRIYASGLPPVRDFPLLRWPTRAVVGTRAELLDRALQGIVAARADHARHLAFSMPLEPHLMAEDGFHPGPIVYAEWARLASEAIAADFRQPD